MRRMGGRAVRPPWRNTLLGAANAESSHYGIASCAIRASLESEIRLIRVTCAAAVSRIKDRATAVREDLVVEACAAVDCEPVELHRDLARDLRRTVSGVGEKSVIRGIQSRKRVVGCGTIAGSKSKRF